MKLIIGCPVREKDTESIQEMLISLHNSTNVYDKIVFVIGQGCSQEVINLLIRWSPLFGFKSIVANEQTKTPLEAYNYLFNLAKQEKSDLLMIQTDVVFPKLYKRDWLQIMSNITNEEIKPQIDVVTCINGGGISGPDYIDGFNWLGGWCTYYSNRVIDKVGGYDESFPNGYGVDIDHTYRIWKEGFRVARMNYWVDHHMQNERLHDNDSKTEQMKQDSARYFKQKWKL